MSAEPVEPATDGGQTPEAELAAVLLVLADANFAGYSPIYEHIARGWAADEEVLALTVGAEAGKTGVLPIKILAAVHDLVLREPGLPLAAIYAGTAGPDADPWPAFRTTVTERWDDLLPVVRTKSIQTNEVGRSAVLLPALTWADEQLGGRPVALVEVGTSAGLNLVLDRYHIDYDDGRSTGDPDARVRLTCSLLSPEPPPLPSPARNLPIAVRVGIDLEPVDVLDPAATRWLEACLWPGVPHRLERLRAAIGEARAEPPTLVAGNALDRLGPTLAGLGPDVVPIVLTSWALAYLDPEGRLAVHDIVASYGRSNDIALVTAEYPHVIPWIPPTRRPLVEEGTDATLLGASVWLDGAETAVGLGWMQAHGLWLDWIGG